MEFLLLTAPKAFVQPHNFIEERWTTQSELVLRKDAYLPFGYGSYACIGKRLALMEMRIVISHFVLNFDIRFPQGKKDTRIVTESKDWFTWGLADLVLQFQPWKEE
jgi:tryprostatin B 6-hydroxylase